MDDIINYIDTKNVGDTIVLKVLRNGNMQDFGVKLFARPTNPSPLQNTTNNNGDQFYP